MTRVQKHKRKGTKGVRSHNRDISGNKKSVPSGLVSYKSGKPQIDDIITIKPEKLTAHGYTILTSAGTLWRPLPKNYKLKGKVTEVKDRSYQNYDAYELSLERISPNPRGVRLRRNYQMWYLKSSGKLVS